MEKYAKVEQFYNKNQFVIKTDKGIVFQSYNSVIAIYENGVLTLGKDWDYSKTTTKHLYLFINDYARRIDFLGVKGFDLASSLNTEKNKRQYIQNCIDNNKIKYDEELI